MKKIILIVFLFTAYFTNAQIIDDNYVIKNIDDNTRYQDYGVSFYGENKVVFASSRKKNSIKKNIWEGNKQPYLQVYSGTIDEEGEIIDVEQFEKGINTKFHDADLTFTKNLKTVYFTSNNFLNKKFVKDSLGWNLNQLYKAEIGDNGKWTNVEAMPFNSDNYQTGHPALSLDEKKLYFISDMPGGYGLTDIYVVDILSDGGYGEPVNLGPNVNTAGKEMFPYIDKLDYLYFSSDGYIDGKGGLDVYVTRIVDNEVQPSFNLESPINSISDDFAFRFQDTKNTGYFSSNRAGGKGDDDIYWFREKTPLSLYCLQFVSGIVTDFMTEEPLEGALVVVYDEFENEIDRTIVGEDGSYSFELTCNNNYKAVASKQEYSIDNKDFFVGYSTMLAEVSLSIKMQEFMTERGKCLIKINPIYFNFDKSEIRKDAEKELDKVTLVMNRYPLIKIESGSHTDSRGPNIYNEKLSARRANSTVKYLISKGIDPSRLTWKGYGETELANDCANGVRCSDADHQFNRRTEFSIINYDEIKEVYGNICEIETVSTKDQIEAVVEEQKDIDGSKAFFIKEIDAKTGDVRIKVAPINFELNVTVLEEEARYELNKVIGLMKDYPNMIIEVGSHTDSRSSSRDNRLLSRGRAQSVVKYIVSNGIDPRRVKGRGYGESKLINGCRDGVRCSEAEHSMNRRVEFVIENPEIVKGVQGVIVNQQENK